MKKEKDTIKKDPKEPKKSYATPKLIVHGTLEEITKKIGGVTDGAGQSLTRTYLTQTLGNELLPFRIRPYH
jgi:hypothetical protein